MHGFCHFMVTSVLHTTKPKVRYQCNAYPRLLHPSYVLVGPVSFPVMCLVQDDGIFYVLEGSSYNRMLSLYGSTPFSNWTYVHWPRFYMCPPLPFLRVWNGGCTSGGRCAKVGVGVLQHSPSRAPQTQPPHKERHLPFGFKLFYAHRSLLGTARTLGDGTVSTILEVQIQACMLLNFLRRAGGLAQP